MRLSNVNGYIDSFVHNFMESSRKEKIVQILCAGSFLLLIYYVASRFLKTDEPPSQGPVNLNGRVATKLETSVEQALSDKTLPPWLKEITENTWKEKIDCEKYGLDFTGAPRINRQASVEGLKALSERVENNMGITTIVRPKGLTLNKVLQIAKEKSVPISPYWYDKIITDFGNIEAEQTCELFFTNSILTGTRNHTSDQHAADVTTIGKECGVAIRMHQVRDFMAFLVLTYLNSPKDARTLLYSSATYARLLEKVGTWSLFGGFAPSGLNACHDYFGLDDCIGVGASGSSEDIGTRNIGT